MGKCCPRVSPAFIRTLLSPSGSSWILATGLWNDSGIWVDSDVWID